MKTKTKPKTRRVRIKPVLAWAALTSDGTIHPHTLYMFTPQWRKHAERYSHGVIRVRIVPLSTPKGRRR